MLAKKNLLDEVVHSIKHFACINKVSRDSFGYIQFIHKRNQFVGLLCIASEMIFINDLVITFIGILLEKKFNVVAMAVGYL